jgi:hypothetical protein
MGRIKSALELALERTESVKGDKTVVEQFEAKQRGKKLAGQFLEGGSVALDDEIKKESASMREALREGIFDILTARINLPVTKDDIKKIEALGKGLQSIIADRGFAAFFKQYVAAASRYLDEAAGYDEAIKRQYAPKLRQKEEDLAQRLGQAIKLDPFQDPEFVAFYNQNMSALKANYEDLAAQVREQVSSYRDNS